VLERGTFRGARFDGRMVGLIGNHVALVPEGRSGADVVIGDSRPTNILSFGQRFPSAARIKII
jgi:hypothetical protein